MMFTAAPSYEASTPDTADGSATMFTDPMRVALSTVAPPSLFLSVASTRMP